MDPDRPPQVPLPLPSSAGETEDGRPVREFTPETTPGLRELWGFRPLLKNLTARALKVKYQRSVLGFFWTLLNPLVTVLVLIAVFSFIIRLGLENYWAFLVSGYFVWNFTQQALLTATYVLQEHAGLNRNVSLPSEIPLVAASLAKLTEFGIEMVLVTLALLIFHQGGIPPSLILLPVAVLILFVTVVGLMFPIATVSVLYRDVQHALPIAITTLFYLSPVFYPVSLVPEAFRSVYYLNPFVGVIELFHVILYQGQWPSPALLGATAAVAAGICLVGYTFFSRYRYICVEVV
jgi:ABC-type polysaccharide/polyol phosphate export permease